jgi:hydrophobe/amphiphile efflux-3 (HAE3) family protein
VRLTDAASRRPQATLLVIVVLSVAGALLALSLRPSVAPDTLISSSSHAYRATATANAAFGAAPVIVLVREPVRWLIAPRDLEAISRLEACIGGHRLVSAPGGGALVPKARAEAYGGPASPCGYLMRTRPVRVVYGPGTFVNQTVVALRAQLDASRATDRRSVEHVARVAYRLAIARGLATPLARAAAIAAAAVQAQRLTGPLAKLAVALGLRGVPSIASAGFTRALVFGSGGARRPRASLAYLFPGATTALIQARLRARLTPSQTARAIAAIRAASEMSQFRLTAAHPYTVSGEPVVLSELAGRITGSVWPLLGGAVIAMAVALILLFGGPLALMPLGIALAAAAVTFGAVALAGADLTLAALAALPILIGLAVDYAIQFQSRTREPLGADARTAVRIAATRGAPAIAAAALATAAGFLALWLSPIPMVREFGVLIVVAIAIALLLALVAYPAVVAVAASGWGTVGASLRGARQLLAESTGGTGTRLDWRRRAGRTNRSRASSSPPTSSERRRPASAVAANFAAGGVVRLARHPLPVLAVAMALALAGWIANSRLAVRSDLGRLAGGDTPALRDLATLERASGVSGELDMIVRATDVARPRTLAWMAAYERRVLAHFGYRRTVGCAGARLCPAVSLPDLFLDREGRLDAAARTSGSIEKVLGSLPGYFTGAVVSADRRLAIVAFGVRLAPLATQERLVDYMRATLRPPSGVRAELGGLPVLAADSGAALSSPARRLLISFAGLLAVGIALLVVWREPRRVLVPLTPIALATGWSSLVLFALRIPLDPLSASLGALVVAITTEFSVLLAERYRQERAAGMPPDDALGTTYRRTGAAVLASGVTVIAGFAVLLISNLTLLRDFGFVTVMDLIVSLVGVVLVLPAAIALGERLGSARELNLGLAAEPLGRPARSTH